MNKKFTRVIEDFICENCGAEVKGNGYTNHCPKCLCSKHVDINPGDRAAECQGLMKPIFVESKREGYIITHKCQKCDHVRKQKACEDDDFQTILEINKKLLK